MRFSSYKFEPRVYQTYGLSFLGPNFAIGKCCSHVISFLPHDDPVRWRGWRLAPHRVSPQASPHGVLSGSLFFLTAFAWLTPLPAWSYQSLFWFPLKCVKFSHYAFLTHPASLQAEAGWYSESWIFHTGDSRRHRMKVLALVAHVARILCQSHVCQQEGLDICKML